MAERPGSVAPELASILAGLEEIKQGRVEPGHPAWVLGELQQLWCGVSWESAPRELPRPDWLVGMTDEFRKAIVGVDRKLQGRILEALGYITKSPVASRGDTVKPLSGQFSDLWRYRIGDYRLVYRPNPVSKQVMLVAFTSRAVHMNSRRELRPTMRPDSATPTTHPSEPIFQSLIYPRECQDLSSWLVAVPQTASAAP
jgi:mRNA-degrading endonuclease RelE of RelBE toxin-antitoxin system